jgi:hypothetical protein
MFIDTSEEIAVAADTQALVRRVAERLLGSSAGMSPVFISEVLGQVNQSTSVNTRVADAIYLIAVSPNFMVQR